jgi:hypothetical protein
LGDYASAISARESAASKTRSSFSFWLLSGLSGSSFFSKTRPESGSVSRSRKLDFPYHESTHDLQIYKGPNINHEKPAYRKGAKIRRVNKCRYRSRCSARWRSWARSRGVILPRPVWFGRLSSSEDRSGLRQTAEDDSKAAGMTATILQAS